MHKTETESTKTYRPILRSWMYYFLAVVLVYATYTFFVLIEQAGIINSRENQKWVLFLPGIYLFCGIMLNIKITRKLINEQYIEYHQFSNTIVNVFRDKISFLLFWVIKYPILLFQITTINRI